MCENVRNGKWEERTRRNARLLGGVASALSAHANDGARALNRTSYTASKHLSAISPLRIVRVDGKVQIHSEAASPRGNGYTVDGRHAPPKRRFYEKASR